MDSVQTLRNISKHRFDPVLESIAKEIEDMRAKLVSMELELSTAVSNKCQCQEGSFW